MKELLAGDQLSHFETGEPIKDASTFLTANAYFGCWGIVQALGDGADIVVTGRTTDAAVVCGPAAWHHGWKRNDWDALAGAVVAQRAVLDAARQPRRDGMRHLPRQGMGSHPRQGAAGGRRAGGNPHTNFSSPGFGWRVR